ncbi:MAG: hypothetical protein EA341_07295 [Mongoliibacter sp.]|nr:MAG: hypothetical protein EA341_07295 [Mongoliibacter sp.]
MDQCNLKAIARPRDKSLQESRLLGREGVEADTRLKYRITNIEFRPPASGRNNEEKISPEV